MNNNLKISLVIAACFVGFFGDLIMQILGRYIPYYKKCCLSEYFKQHGPVESLFIAMGLMSFLYITYIYVFKFPIKWYYIALYGIIWDLIFRVFRVFPSLDQFYDNHGYLFTAILGGAVPILMPYVVVKIYEYIKNRK